MDSNGSCANERNRAIYCSEHVPRRLQSTSHASCWRKLTWVEGSRSGSKRHRERSRQPASNRAVVATPSRHRPRKRFGGSRMNAPRERGTGSTLAISAGAVIVMVAGACMVAVLLLSLHQRAGQGADFAALAASKASVDGQEGCAAARRIAKANGTRITSCRMDAEVATVTARAEIKTPLGAWGIRQRARAAPSYYFE